MTRYVSAIGVRHLRVSWREVGMSQKDNRETAAPILAALWTVFRILAVPLFLLLVAVIVLEQ
jgi:hypothetical protein